jgi:hypothetical protein
VVSAKFNHDGSLVATGDMAGNVQVWKVASQEKVMEDSVSELNVSPSYSCSWDEIKIQLFSVDGMAPSHQCSLCWSSRWKHNILEGQLRRMQGFGLGGDFNRSWQNHARW